MDGIFQSQRKLLHDTKKGRFLAIFISKTMISFLTHSRIPEKTYLVLIFYKLFVVNSECLCLNVTIAMMNHHDQKQVEEEYIHSAHTPIS